MRPAPRLYVNIPLSFEAIIPLAEGQAKYIARVMRLGVGDRVRVFNGSNGEWQCEIAEITGKNVLLRAIEQTQTQPSPPKSPLTLMFAPLKKAQTDFVIEKATELGVRAIQPIITERTQTRKIRTDRLEKIAIEAAEQTERFDLPEIAELVSMDEALEKIPSDSVVIYCDEAGDDPAQSWGGPDGRAGPAVTILQALQEGSAVILIGPEGGFSPEERRHLRERENIQAISLGPRILRAETAVVSALTLWQAICGDW